MSPYLLTAARQLLPRNLRIRWRHLTHGGRYYYTAPSILAYHATLHAINKLWSV